ncbi:MAG: hypothetical protein AAFY46_08195 [Planctomycetota bacterium]
MVPTPADIARYRHIAAAVVRGVGLLLLIYSATRVGVYLWNNFDGIARQFNAGGGGNVRTLGLRRYIASLVLPTVLLAFSVVLVGWPAFVARWLVPARVRAACPGCGFALSGLRSVVCPECGLKLGAEFLSEGEGEKRSAKAGGGQSE